MLQTVLMIPPSQQIAAQLAGALRQRKSTMELEFTVPMQTYSMEPTGRVTVIVIGEGLNSRCIPWLVSGFGVFM
jgi:hypothetical protein